MSEVVMSKLEIFLKETFPLVVEYNVANLGKIQFCLAPSINPGE